MSKKERAAAARAAREAAAARRRAKLPPRRDPPRGRRAASDRGREHRKGRPDWRRSVRSQRGARLARLARWHGRRPRSNTGRVLSIVNQRMAIGTGVKPCSTFKPVVALAAMDEKLMTTNDSRYLRGCGCEVDLDDAMAYSSNEFFQQLGKELGLARLVAHARTCGFGECTGINLPNNSGAAPVRDSLRRAWTRREPRRRHSADGG